MSIDFGKFKKKPVSAKKTEREIVREELSDNVSDKVEKSTIITGKKSDKSDIPPNYNITSDHLRAIYVLLTGKTNRGYSKKILKRKIVEILTNGV